MDQGAPAATGLESIMMTLVYLCPTTGQSVQGWLADGVSENAGETYEAVMCTACSRVHRAMGESW